MPTPWNDDPSGYEGQIASNAVSIVSAMAPAVDQRETPTVAMAQQWHRDMYDQIPVPVPYYAGEIRDSDPQYPELYGYEVVVGQFQGAPSAHVPQELATFEGRAQRAVQILDRLIAVGDKPANNAEGIGVLQLCARLHGEWIRIHPFANGNGRTARLWANWAALRYGLPPFVTIKPRPGLPYGAAAMGSMQGDHAPMTAVFHQLLRDYISRNA